MDQFSQLQQASAEQQITTSSLSTSSSLFSMQTQHIYEQRLQQLQQRHDHQVHQIQTLQSELRKSKRTQDQLGTEKVQLQRELLEAKSQNQNLEHQLQNEIEATNNTRQIQQKLTQDKEELNKQIAEMDNTHRQELKRQRDQLVEALKANTNLEQELEQLKLKLSSLESTIRITQNEKDALQKFADDQSKRISELMHELGGKIEDSRNYERQIESLKRELDNDRKLTQGTCDQQLQLNRQTQLQNQQLRQQLTEERARYDQLDLEAKRIKDSFSRIEQEKSQAVVELASTKLGRARLQTDYDACFKIKGTLEKQCDELKNELAKLQEKYRNLSLAKVGDESNRLADENEILKFQDELKLTFEQSKKIPETLEQMNREKNILIEQNKEHRKLLIFQKEQNNKLHQELISFSEKFKQHDLQQQHLLRSQKSLNLALQERQRQYSLLQMEHDCLIKAIKRQDLHGRIQQEYNSLIITLQGGRSSNDNNQDQKLLLFREEIEKNDELLQNYEQEKDLRETIEKKKVYLEEQVARLEAQVKQRDNQVQRLNERLKEAESKQSNSQKRQSQDVEMKESVNLANKAQTVPLEVIKYYQDQIEIKTTQIAELRKEKDEIQSRLEHEVIEKSQLQGKVISSQQDVINRSDFETLKRDYDQTLRDLTLSKAQLLNLEQRIQISSQNIETERAQRLHSESKLQECLQALDQERKQVQLLKMVQIETAASGDVGNREGSQLGGRDEFKTLAELINELRREQERLMRELRTRDVKQIQLETQISSQQLVVESLKHQLQSEQQSKQEIQKMFNELVRQNPSLQRQPSQDQSQNQQNLQQQSLQQVNEELKALLITQNEQNEKELQDRDKLIDLLQQMLNDLNLKLNEQHLLFEENIQPLSRESEEENQRLRERLAQSELENSNLKTKKESLEAQVTSLKEEKEKYEVVGGMQQSEIRRLESSDNQQLQRASSQGNNLNHLRQMSDRVDDLQLQFAELERELQVSRNDFMIKEQSWRIQKESLEEEISSLKEREAILRNQNEVLQRHLEQIRRTSAENINQSDISMFDTSLLERERIERLESENERLRRDWHNLNDENKKIRSESNHLSFKNIKLEEEINSLKEQSVFKNYQLRHFEEVNEQNRELVEEKKKMQEEIEKIKSEERQSSNSKVNEEVVNQRVQEEVAKQILQLANEMRQFKQQNELLRQELQNRASNPNQDPNQQQATGIQQQKSPVFKEMYRSLIRAKQILMGIAELLGINPHADSADNEGGGFYTTLHNMLGKRQRTE